MKLTVITSFALGDLLYRHLPSLHASKKKGKPKEKEKLFIDYATRLASRLGSKRCPNTIRNYHTALRSLATFLPDGDIAVTHLTSEVVKEYVAWLTMRGVSINTASCYLRSLRSLYSHAVGALRCRQRQPFAGAYTGNAPTSKRAMSQTDLRRLLDLQLEEGSPLQLALDIFTFSLYAMGMPFADVSRIRRSQIHDGILEYRRHKTGQRVCVRIEPCMMHILERYHCPGDDRLFPILPLMPCGYDDHNAYLRALGRYNYALCVIARKAGLSTNLSSYVSRHTWASMAYHSHIPIPTIAQAMGHTTPHTTSIYLKPFKDSYIARANRKILQRIMVQTSVEEEGDEYETFCFITDYGNCRTRWRAE